MWGTLTGRNASDTYSEREIILVVTRVRGRCDCFVLKTVLYSTFIILGSADCHSCPVSFVQDPFNVLQLPTLLPAGALNHVSTTRI